MFSGHLIRMLLGLAIIGVLGMVSLFLINKYDKEQNIKNEFSEKAFRANLP